MPRVSGESVGSQLWQRCLLVSLPNPKRWSPKKTHPICLQKTLVLLSSASGRPLRYLSFAPTKQKQVCFWFIYVGESLKSLTSSWLSFKATKEEYPEKRRATHLVNPRRTHPAQQVSAAHTSDTIHIEQSRTKSKGRTAQIKEQN